MSSVYQRRLRFNALRSCCLIICLAATALPQTDDQTAVRRLAESLSATKTEDEQRALLAAEPELVTVELEKALVRQGQRLSSQGDYAEALMMYQLASQVAEQIGDKTGMSEAAQLIAHLHSFQGMFTAAFEYAQKSLTLAEEVGDKTLIAKALGGLALVHSLQGNYGQALEYYRKSLALAEEVGDKTLLVRVLNNLGAVYSSQGNYRLALEYYQQSFKLVEAMGDKAGMAAMLSNIGNLHEAQGNYAQALEHYRKSLLLAEEVGDAILISSGLSNVGIMQAFQGNYAQALEQYLKSRKLSEKVDDKGGLAITLGAIGNVYRSQGDSAQALNYYRQSLTLAEEIGDKEWAVETLNNIATVDESRGDYAQAIKLSARAVSLAVQTGNLEGLWQARTIAGKAYRALNQTELAAQAFVEAIATIERLRDQVAGGEQDRQRFFENKLAPYLEMVELLSSQNKPAEALAYAERAKGRVLLDVLRNGRDNLNRAMTRAEQEQELKLNSELIALNMQLNAQRLQGQPDDAQLADLNSRLEKTRLEYESFQTNLYAAHPELKVQRGETPPLSLSEAAHLLPADGNTALLEYVVSDEKSFLFVLTRAARGSKQDASTIALKVYPLNIKRKALTALVETFHQRLSDRNLAFNDLAQRLYQLLLKPVQAQLRNTKTLCIVPDGVLWQLPFQALKPTANHYLIEDQAIFYAPSLTTLREMIKPHNRTSEGRALLAFGNPLLNPQTLARQQFAYQEADLGSLPEAEREVNALREIYGGERSRVYTGAAAREERVKAEIGNYRIVHFATHGILDNNNPLYSYLLLAQEPEDSGEDGFLEAHEIMKMNLQAELVVLSACQTAGGRVSAGEGVVGMTWAFFVAGSPTTLVSQWKVDTRSTSKLMVEFHGNLQRQRQRSTASRKAEALRQAMLTLLKSEQYELPYYWASFVLVGNGF